MLITLINTCMSKYTSEDINNTIKAINQDRTLLDMLLEVDGLLEHLGLYAFKNWKKGKVVEVGRPSKYWIDLTLMYDKSDMPDPEGALRLTNKDCKVKFNEDVFEYPKKITGPEDIEVEIKRNRVYRKTKTEADPVWLVELRIPRKYVETWDNKESKMNDEVISTQDAGEGAMLQQGVDPMAQAPMDPGATI
jgi:hypothetical protein